MSNVPSLSDRFVSVGAYMTDEAFGHDHWRAAQFSAPKPTVPAVLVIFKSDADRDNWLADADRRVPDARPLPAQEREAVFHAVMDAVREYVTAQGHPEWSDEVGEMLAAGEFVSRPPAGTPPEEPSDASGWTPEDLLGLSRSMSGGDTSDMATPSPAPRPLALSDEELAYLRYQRAETHFAATATDGTSNGKLYARHVGIIDGLLSRASRDAASVPVGGARPQGEPK